MSTTSATFPATNSDDAAVGTLAWTNPTNIGANDNNNATAASISPGGQYTHYLKGLMGANAFAIPAGSTIDGITVKIGKYQTIMTSGGVLDTVVSLVIGGTVSGSNYAAAGAWASSETEYTYGGATDKWGLTPTVAQVNATDFGVVLEARVTGGGSPPPKTTTAYVDYFTITINYSTPVYNQEHFQVYQDDAGLNSATAIGSEDADYSTAPTGTNIRLRFETANTGDGAGNITRRLEFKEGAGAWTQITTTSINVRLAASAQYADGDATTSRLTAVGTFTAGQGKDTGSDTSQISLTNAYNTEDEYCIAFQPGADGLSYQFRITNAGTALDTYTHTPTITVADQNIEILRPNSNEFSPAWTAYGGAGGSNFDTVDEVTADEDTTYEYSSPTGGRIDIFGTTDPTGITAQDTINSVTVYFRGKWAGAEETQIRAKVSDGTTTATGSYQVMTSTYLDYSETWALSPDGDAWTLTDLNNLRIGYEDNTHVGVARVTQNYAAVNYTVGVSFVPKIIVF